MYQMPVRAIKNILKKELEDFYSHGYRAIKEKSLSDVPAEMLGIAREALLKNLEACESYESLEDYISLAGYRMSLQEWIDSL